MFKVKVNDVVYVTEILLDSLAVQICRNLTITLSTGTTYLKLQAVLLAAIIFDFRIALGHQGVSLHGGVYCGEIANGLVN